MQESSLPLLRPALSSAASAFALRNFSILAFSAAASEALARRAAIAFGSGEAASLLLALTLTLTLAEVLATRAALLWFKFILLEITLELFKLQSAKIRSRDS